MHELACHCSACHGKLRIYEVPKFEQSKVMDALMDVEGRYKNVGKTLLGGNSSMGAYCTSRRTELVGWLRQERSVRG